MSAPRTTPTALTREDLAAIAEALDSHLYWQVCQDLTRRRDGEVTEPYTAEEQAVVDLIAKVEALTQTT